MLGCKSQFHGNKNKYAIMKSKLLLSHLPELYGNVRVLVKKDGSVYLDVINDSNESLSVSKMYSFPINLSGGYVNDLSNLFEKSAYRNVYDKSEYSSSSLFINGESPDGFISYNINESGFLEVTDYFDLSDRTDIGKYIRDHISKLSKLNPISIYTDRKEIEIYGINLEKGILNDFYLYYEDESDINDMILTYIQNNKILLPNLINLDFELSGDGEFSAFINNFKLGNIDIQTLDKKIIGNSIKIQPFVLREFIGKEGDISMTFRDNNILLTCVDNVDQRHFLYNDGNSVISHSDITIKPINSRHVDLEKIYDPYTYYKIDIVKSFGQSDVVTITVNGESYEFITDYMPNLLEAGIPFSNEDNNWNAFNWKGSLEETSIAFSKAFNQVAGAKSRVTCVPHKKGVYIIGKFGGAFNMTISSEHMEISEQYVEDTFNNSYYFSHEKIDDKDNDYLLLNGKIYEILSIRDNIEINNSTGRVFREGYIVEVKGIINDDRIKTYILEYPNLELNVIDVGVLTDIDREFFIKNNFDIRNIIGNRQLKEFYEYTVCGANSKILYNGVEYVTGQSFTTNYITSFSVISGSGNVIDKKMYGDIELKDYYFLNTENDMLNIPSVTFSQHDSSDFEYNDSNMSISVNPDSSAFSMDFNKRTNEWLIPAYEPYMSRGFSEEALIKSNYHLNNLNKYSSVFKKYGDMYKTTFKGADIIVNNSDLEGYSFIAILCPMTDDNYMEGVRYKLIKDNKNKAVILAVSIPISDYRYKEMFSLTMTYYTKNTKRNKSSNKISFQGAVNFNGVKIKSSISDIDGNKIRFNQKVSMINMLTDSNEGMSLMFISKDRSTIISNYGYIDGNGNIIKEMNVLKMKPIGNAVEISDGYVYATKINDIPYNTPISYGELHGLLDFSTLECYQIGDFSGDLENILSNIIFSSVREIYDKNKDFIEKIDISEDGEISESDISIEFPDFNTVNSGKYNVSIEDITKSGGSTVQNIMFIYDDMFKDKGEPWDKIDDSFNALDKYSKEPLNIVKK